MAGDWRTLKLEILAETQQFVKGMNESEKQVQTFGDKVTDFSKKAALAFAAAAAAAVAYAGKLAIDGVKAAMEDEQAQLKLASALQSATGATSAQIKATEDYISKTSLAVGIADDELRPAFQRLAIATGDVTKSQELLSLAVDISKGSGKDLSAVTEALSRAYAGQETSLVRLGVGITAAQAKTMDFRGEVQALSDLYGGAAARNAETFQGKIDRLKVGFNEAKESLGYALIPYVEKFVNFLNDSAIPALNGFIAGFTGDQGLNAALKSNQEAAANWGREFASIIKVISGFIGFLKETIGLVIELANQLIRAYNIIQFGKDVPYLENPSSNPNVLRNQGTGGMQGFPRGGGGTLQPGGGGGGGLTIQDFISGGGSTGGAGGTGRGTGGVGGTGVLGISGATSVKDLVDRLTNVQDKFTDLTFQVATSGITNAAAKSQLDKLTAEFRVLEKQGATLTSQALGTNAVYSPTSGTVINLNVSGAIDSEGTARTIIDQLTASFNRGGVVSNPYQLIDR